MRRAIFALAVTAVVLSACGRKQTNPVSAKVQDYATVKIGIPDLSYISVNGREVLNLYRFAAMQADSIYWDQYSGLQKEMDALDEGPEKDFAKINYGPWDRFTGKAFIAGYGDQPKGANFYPADMTAEEFTSLNDSLKNSPYTLIRRDSAGALKIVPYHTAYKDRIEIIGSLLQSAADLTIVPSVRTYLLAKKQALLTDQYDEADEAWLDMKDSKMDLILGPDEINDDQLYGLKASYEAYVLLKDLKMTEEMGPIAAMLPDLQRLLPCDDAYKSMNPSSNAEIFVYDAIYMAGHANAGTKLIALNEPNNVEVALRKGTRTILLRNIMDYKFNMIVSPTGHVVLGPDQVADLDADAFFWNIAFREISHNLGAIRTTDGRDVNEAMGQYALAIEDAKANAAGLYLVCKLLADHKLPAISTPEQAISTFVANLIRSERFGSNEELGKAYLIIYNYFYAHGAFTRHDDGKYHIDYAKALEAAGSLTSELVKIQASGDVQAAAKIVKDYAKYPVTFNADLTNLRLEGIPADIAFEFDN